MSPKGIAKRTERTGGVEWRYSEAPWVPLPPGAFRIMEALGSAELKSYTNIKKDAKLQDPSLIKHLRRLVEIGFVERDSGTRAYRITERGKAELDVLEVIQNLVHDLRSHPGHDTRGKIVIVNETNSEEVKQVVDAMAKRLRSELGVKHLLVPVVMLDAKFASESERNEPGR
jgi:DNA-binding MarR family transcriptional regulator